MGYEMNDNGAQTLLEPIRLGDLRLPNRIVMAPLTRSRAENIGLTPTSLHAEYYSQRASAGLIISEGVWISPSSIGWNDVPGLFSDEQVLAWRHDRRSAQRGRPNLCAALALGGNVSSGLLQRSAAASSFRRQSFATKCTPTGHKDTVTPRAMSRDEIKETIRDYATAARNAREAGFDGVQIQAGWLYLISQFLNPKTNLRTDEYGGPIENRARLLFEVLDAVASVIDSKRIGLKTGPAFPETGMFTSTAETLPTFEYVISRLNDGDLSHLLLMGAMADLSATPLAALQGDGMFRHFREIYSGNLIGNVGFDRERANKLIKEGVIDLTAFGRPFIANPDLPARFAKDAPLNDVDLAKIYGGGAEGYTDYPFLGPVAAKTNPVSRELT
jgi:N-ethylmaleimide reductase